MDNAPPADSSDPSKSKNFITRLLDAVGLSRTPDTTEDLEQEIQELLEDGEEHGLITGQEGRMIYNIFEFRETLAREVMTPRSEVVSAEVSASIPETISLIREYGFSRIPVYEETTDHVIGILHAKDLLACINAEGSCPVIRDLIKPVYFVSENKRIVDLLKDFQSKKIHMAVVTDEFGGVRGIVTLEDVLEEIVGEIDDEYDDEDNGWRELADGSILIYAKDDIEDVEEHFKVTLPEGPYESVGGLIIHQLGHLPEPSEKVEIGGLEFRVVSATKRYIKTVRIQRLA